jgi:lactoylglutathione lyase
MPEQVDVPLGPGAIPDGLHHHGASVGRRGKSQRRVLVDLHPCAAVRHGCPPVSGIQPAVVGEQDDEVQRASPRELSHLRQQPAREPAGPLALPDAEVDDAERPQDIGADPNNPELHAHLGYHRVTDHREIAEMGRQLEIGPARVPGKALLQQRLQLIAENSADLRLGDPDDLAVLIRPHRQHVTLLTMFVTGLVNLYTRDIEAGLHFYRDLLGFSETFRTPAEGVPEHVELRLDGFTVGLGTVEAAKRVHDVEAAPGSPAMVLVVWTDDVDGACMELAAAGVPVLQPPHDTGNNNRNALLRDPDGNLVEIVAKVPPLSAPA